MQSHVVVSSRKIKLCAIARACITFASALDSTIPNDLNYNRILNGLRCVVIVAVENNTGTCRQTFTHSRHTNTHIHTLTTIKANAVNTNTQQSTLPTTETAKQNSNWKVAKQSDPRHTVRITSHSRAWFQIEKEDGNGTAKPMLEMWNVHFKAHSIQFTEAQSVDYFGARGQFKKFTDTRWHDIWMHIILVLGTRMLQLPFTCCFYVWVIKNIKYFICK